MALLGGGWLLPPQPLLQSMDDALGAVVQQSLEGDEQAAVEARVARWRSRVHGLGQRLWFT